MKPSAPPFRHVDFAPRSLVVHPLAGGGMILENPTPLGRLEPHINVYFRRAAEQFPDRLAFAERDAAGAWRKISYGAALAQVDALTQALIDRGLGPDRPVMILSGNGIEHALLTMAALQAAAPVAPVSAAYSLMSKDFAKLRHVFDLVKPALVFAQHGRMFESALRALPLDGVEVVAATAPSERLAMTPLADLLAARPTAAVAARLATLGPDSVAKYLFTSGSTGLPKGVINTHGNLCAVQRMTELIDRRSPDDEYVVLEWLPWSHTYGGNINFFTCMRNAGSMYIDAGKPIPGMFEATIANLKDVSPSRYTNVPAGYAMLLDRLEQDAELARAFFKRLNYISYGGANLPMDLWQRMQDVAVKTTGERIVFVTGWGATESAALITLVHWAIEGSGVIGLPIPGVQVKMVPSGDKMELRVKGPNIFPGYLGRPDLTAAAFDADGFYMIGDAGRLADPADPQAGIRFDGRVAEDFKLETGTWVRAGGLRVAALAAASPLLRDAVVTGHDRLYVGLLAWPNLEACLALCGDAPPAPQEALRHPAVIERLRAGLAAHNRRHPGSSERIMRAMLMLEPPSIDAGEITDKGYINQRATLDRRADLVARLYAATPAADVIIIDETG